MVMFLFVIAYLGDRTDEAPWAGGPSWQVGRRPCSPAGAILVEVIVVVGLDDRRLRSRTRQHIHRAFGSPASIGRLFLTDQLLAFEVTSIVLLVAAVGGVVLGSHARDDRATRSLAEDGGGGCTALTSPGTSSSPAMLFVDRRARRAAAPQPADHPALGRDHAERRRTSPLIAFSRHCRPRGRPGLRDRRDGDRRLRGRRRPRADRRDGPPQRRARRRQAPDAARMSDRTPPPGSACCCRSPPRSLITLAGDAHLAPRRRLPLDR